MIFEASAFLMGPVSIMRWYFSNTFMMSWQAGARLQKQPGLLKCPLVSERSLDGIKASQRHHMWTPTVKVQHMPPLSKCHKLRSDAVSWRVLQMLVLGYANEGRGVDCQQCIFVAHCKHKYRIKVCV